MTTKADLTTWLRTQLDREAGDALLIPGGGYQAAWWTTHRHGDYIDGALAEIRQHDLPVGETEEDGPEVSVAGYMARGRNEDEHVARWCPARVLREVKTKQRIIDLHAQTHDTLADLLGFTVPDMCAVDAESWPCPTLRILALPYDDRPGYQEEWRP